METPRRTRRERARDGRITDPTAAERARRYQELARKHRDEERFWLCRASFFGRLSLRS